MKIVVENERTGIIRYVKSVRASKGELILTSNISEAKNYVSHTHIAVEIGKVRELVKKKLSSSNHEKGSKILTYVLMTKDEYPSGLKKVDRFIEEVCKITKLRFSGWQPGLYEGQTDKSYENYIETSVYDVNFALLEYYLGEDILHVVVDAKHKSVEALITLNTPREFAARLIKLLNEDIHTK